jgi:hypothetical protein
MTLYAPYGLGRHRRYRRPNDVTRMAPLPGNNLPAEALALWERVHDTARTYYTDQLAPDPEKTARHTAWKAVRMFFEKKGSAWVPKGDGPIQAGVTHQGQPVYFGEAPEKLPKFDPVAKLAALLEYSYLNEDAEFCIVRFVDPGLPKLTWDKPRRMLVTYVGIELPVPEPLEKRDPTLRKAANMHNKWSHHSATEVYRTAVPDLKVMPLGVADTIVYRSPKFDRDNNPHPDAVGSTEYLHNFDQGVFLEADPEFVRNPNRAPKVLIASGGRLDVWPDGIVF